LNLPFFIARRYLFSKKTSNAINIITLISMVGIMVGTAALIIVLSVFNGLSSLLEGLFAAIDPDVKVVAAEGKYFVEDEDLRARLEALPEVAVLTRSLEDRVVMQYFDKQVVATLKGVDEKFAVANPIDSSAYLWEGSYSFEPHAGVQQGVFGQGVAARLSLNVNDRVHPIAIKVLNDQANSLADLGQAIIFESLFPAGLFSVQKEYDDKYVLVDLAFARDLFSVPQGVSAYEIALHDLKDLDQVKAKIEGILGPEYRVITWYEQHESLYRVMRNEKYIGYLILTLLLAIAAINIVGSLSMIVLEKTRDIAVLKSMGATTRLIRRTFLLEGVLVGGIGVGVGMALAFTFGILQQEFGILRLQGGENFRISAFPLEMRLEDFVLIFLTVTSLSLLAALYPAFKAAQVGVVEGLRK
jgi:lipoprotein-releasing system permease protein